MKKYLLKAVIPALMLSLAFGGVVYADDDTNTGENTVDIDTDEDVSNETGSNRGKKDRASDLRARTGGSPAGDTNSDAGRKDNSNKSLRDRAQDLIKNRGEDEGLNNNSGSRTRPPQVSPGFRDGRDQDANRPTKEAVNSDLRDRLQKAEGAHRKLKAGGELNDDEKEDLKRVKDARVKAQDVRRTDRKEQIEGSLQRAKDARVKAKDLKNKEKTQLRERLSKVQDEKKRAVVEKISQKFNDILKKSTDRLAGYLNKAEAVLQRIENRTDEVEDRGVDVTATRQAISSAYSRIDSARGENTAQTTEVVSLSENINDEETLKTDVQRVRDSLKRKLETLRSRAFGARDAVKVAAQALRTDFTNSQGLENNN